MLHRPSFHPLRRWHRVVAAIAACGTAALSLSAALAAPLAVDDAGAEHLVISELLTGSASASDEFIEVYNPTASDVPLDGLELIYVSSSGATITRKATWDAAATALPPGRHLLVANESGTYAAIADATYGGGLAAAGGSVAIRVAGADTAIDAVGWGTAVSTWLEGNVAAAPPAGHSLERLPGGVDGSGQDTDDNSLDFVERAQPAPENLASPPVPEPPVATPTMTPSPAASPTPTPTPMPTPTPTPAPTASPTPASTPLHTPSPAIGIAAARAMPDGTLVTIEGTALTDSAFFDGGGFVADPTAGIAVLVTDGAFVRGAQMRITGTIGDRYAQRTLRAEGTDITVLGEGVEPEPVAVTTGTVNETVEGRLVVTSGAVAGPTSPLTGAVAFDLDDGSGSVRLVIGDTTGIDGGAWAAGTRLSIRGVVDQRDSSGTGTSGYRLMPRDESDVLSILEPSPTPASSPAGSPTPMPTATPGTSATDISDARGSAKNTRLVVRGVVTMPSGLFEPAAAVVEDESGAIYLRLGDDAGELAVGQLIEAAGVHSTWTGMESLRISEPPQQLGEAAVPTPLSRATGAIGEPEEARLVIVRGIAASAPRRTSAHNSYFDLDDGSGPLRVFLSPALAFDVTAIAAGARLEVRGVVLQATTGQQPLRGYRLWPVTGADVRVLGPAAAASASSGGTESAADGSGASGGPAGIARASSTPAPRRAQPEPQLAIARPTAASVVPATPEPGAAEGRSARHPAPTGAVVLLGLAAVLAAVAGGLLLRGSFLKRLANFAGLPGGVDDSVVAEPAVDSASGSLEGLPELIGLAPIATDAAPSRALSALSTPGASGGSGKDGGILPRT